MQPYFPAALNLLDEPALVVGGDWEAADKAAKLAAAGARVTVVTEAPGPELQAVEGRENVRIERRPFAPDDAGRARVVVLADQDPELAAALRAQGRRDGFWLCAVDQPAHCDWVNVGYLELGPMRIALSSGGGAPGLIKRVREGLEAGLGARFGRFAERLAALRQSLSDRSSAERRRRMAAALEGFELEVRVRYPAWEADPEGQPPT